MTGDGGLQVLDLRKAYPTPAEPLVVLDGVSFALNRGECAAIVGPSGSGKSTLLNIIGTLDSPTGGTVQLDQTNPFALDSNALARFRAERIGFVFQEHHLLPQCSALENVVVARMALGHVEESHIARAKELLRLVGLENRQTHVPAELSGGERQRVAVARALMNSPALLLCDEPTGSLDSRSAAAVADLLFSVARDARLTLITVTHSADLASRFPQRFRMDDGHLRKEGA